jgi:prephenate dehydrogenase
VPPHRPPSDPRGVPYRPPASDPPAAAAGPGGAQEAGGSGADLRLRRIAVVGLGLVGGSLLRRLGTARHAGPYAGHLDGYEVVGYDVDPGVRAAVEEAGYPVAPSVADAVAAADLVVLATPLSALPDVLPEVTATAPLDAVLTDVTSVKVAALDAVCSAGVRQRYVGGHPMAGTERSGFAASDPRLFDGAVWVLCLDRATDLAAWVALAATVTSVGCRAVPCGTADHDVAVARISGLPHLLASVLAASAVSGPPGDLALALAAGSFRDGTRVSATRPDLAALLCDGNRGPLADVLSDAVDRLVTVRDALLAGGSALPLLSEGYAARERWQARQEGGERFDLDAADPALRDRLRALGASGGHVERVVARTLRCWRPVHVDADSMSGP